MKTTLGLIANRGSSGSDYKNLIQLKLFRSDGPGLKVPHRCAGTAQGQPRSPWARRRSVLRCTQHASMASYGQPSEPTIRPSNACPHSTVLALVLPRAIHSLPPSKLLLEATTKGSANRSESVPVGWLRPLQPPNYNKIVSKPYFSGPGNRFNPKISTR